MIFPKLTLSRQVKSLRAALDGARRDLDAIRDRIAGLKTQRVNVERAPVDRAEIERRLDAVIGQIDPDDVTFGSLATPVNRFDPADFGDRLRGSGAFALLHALDPARLRAFMLAGLPADGLSDAERAAKLATIDAEIAAAEVAEEIVLREIEDGTAVDMPRRADANPAVLLAPTAELVA